MIWRTSGIVALQQELVFQLGGIIPALPQPEKPRSDNASFGCRPAAKIWPMIKPFRREHS